ncbi:MAG: twin-arginine translocase subunit TatC [Candidatus Sumerlaeota bacterium]
MIPFKRSSRKNDNPEAFMGILEHLGELRKRLILSLVFLMGGMVVGTFVAKPALGFLFRPFERMDLKRQEQPLRVRIDEAGVWHTINLPDDTSEPSRLSSRVLHIYLPGADLEGEPSIAFGSAINKPVFFNPIDPIMLWLKASFFIGLVLALPLILHQAWLFVMPGLTPGERRAMVPILALAAFLFPAGATFAYLAFQPILDFLIHFQIGNIEPVLSAYAFLNVELKFMLGFGVAFEMPIAIMFLTLMGLLTPERLRKWRPYAILVIGFMSMMLTPPDPLSMIMMMLPLFVLYEFSILLSIPVARKRKEEQEELEKWLEETDKEEEAGDASSARDDIDYSAEPPRAPLGGRKGPLAGGEGKAHPATDPGHRAGDEDWDYEDYEEYYARKARQHELQRKRWLRKKLHRKRRRGGGI